MNQRTEPEDVLDPAVLVAIQGRITLALRRLRRYREIGEDTRAQEAAMNRLIDEWKQEAGV